MLAKLLPGKIGKMPIDPGQGDADSGRALAAALATSEGVKNAAAASALMSWRADPRWFSAAAVELREVVADPDHPVHLVVRGLIRKGEGDIATIWRIMAEPRWASACRERLSGRLTRAERETLRQVRYLALNPARGVVAGESAECEDRAKPFEWLDGAIGGGAQSGLTAPANPAPLDMEAATDAHDRSSTARAAGLHADHALR